MRIVVVEDEMRTRRGIVALLKKLSPDYEVVGEAENGLVGSELVTRLNPDLVIADVKMPGMDGIEMLESLRKAGVRCRAVILSGYSEFEYAQKAIKMGVSEYLLKPVTVEDLENTVKNIGREIETERNLEEKQSSFSSVEHILQNLILGDITDGDKSIEYLNEKHNLHPDSEYIAIVTYLGNDFANRKEEVKRIISPLLLQLPGLSFHLIDLNAHNELLILIQSPENTGELERYFQNSILTAVRIEEIRNVIMGWIQFNGLQNLKSSLQTLNKELKWSMVLGDDVLVSYPKTSNIHTRPVQYPVAIERNVKAAIYSRDMEKLNRNISEFLDLWCKELYRPEYVIDAFVRFASSIVNVVKEMNEELYYQINQKKILQNIIDSFTWYEIKSSLLEISERVTSYHKAGSKPYSLVINKALGIIGENYSNAVTLEETASRLCITPEYLSNLFCREVGENFSTYIKNFRIHKAKELLMNTELKSYEIGSRVGYADPKYFSRVFKEVTGFSPGEYQKAYKV